MHAIPRMSSTYYMHIQTRFLQVKARHKRASNQPAVADKQAALPSKEHTWVVVGNDTVLEPRKHVCLKIFYKIRN